MTDRLALPDPLLFVGGTPRSGTTLLRNMLAAHPWIAIPNESFFIHRVHDDLRRSNQLHDVGLAWHIIKRDPFFRAWRLDPHDVEGVLSRVAVSTYTDLIRALFVAFAESQGKTFAGDKTPTHALRFTWLAREFPTSCFVHIVRDPRGVCMSLTCMPWQLRGLVGAALTYKGYVQAALGAEPRLGRRLIRVHYEDVIADAEAELGRICALVGVDYDPKMLSYGDPGDPLPARHHRRSRGPLVSNARPWREQTTKTDIAVVELITGRTMKRVGYQLTAPRWSVRAWSALAGDRLRRAPSFWIEKTNHRLYRLSHPGRDNNPSLRR